MLKRLYDWTLALAARKTAEVWLAIIAFVESSVFLVPADVLFLPMALARGSGWWWTGSAIGFPALGGWSVFCLLGLAVGCKKSFFQDI